MSDSYDLKWSCFIWLKKVILSLSTSLHKGPIWVESYATIHITWTIHIIWIDEFIVEHEIYKYEVYVKSV